MREGQAASPTGKRWPRRGRQTGVVDLRKGKINLEGERPQCQTGFLFIGLFNRIVVVSFHLSLSLVCSRSVCNTSAYGQKKVTLLLAAPWSGEMGAISKPPRLAQTSLTIQSRAILCTSPIPFPSPHRAFPDPHLPCRPHRPRPARHACDPATLHMPSGHPTPTDHLRPKSRRAVSPHPSDDIMW